MQAHWEEEVYIRPSGEWLSPSVQDEVQGRRRLDGMVTDWRSSGPYLGTTCCSSDGTLLVSACSLPSQGT